VPGTMSVEFRVQGVHVANVTYNSLLKAVLFFRSGLTGVRHVSEVSRVCVFLCNIGPPARKEGRLK
jgi:hypothetical protein